MPERTRQPDPAPGLEAPIQALVGPATAERLKRLGILRVQDLLLHLPIRYEDRTRLTPLGDLRPGQSALVEGQVEYAEPGRGRRRSLVAGLRDASGAIRLRFFHFHPAQLARLAGGPRLRCFGAVSQGPLSLEMVHPECAFPGDRSRSAARRHAVPGLPEHRRAEPAGATATGGTRLRALTGRG